MKQSPVTTLNTIETDPQPVDRRRALDRLDRHLERVGEPCSDADCVVCHSPAVAKEVTRLSVAHTEYRMKVQPLRRAVRENLCVYCGDVPNDRDHLLPKWWTGEGLRRHVPTVAACRSCNGILSDLPDPTIAARTQHIAERLRRRWGKELRNRGNLKGLQGTLRSQIQARNFKRNVIRGRLLVLDLGGVPEISAEWQEQLLAAGPTAVLPSDTAGEEDADDSMSAEPHTAEVGNTLARAKRRTELVRPPVRARITKCATPGSAYAERTEARAGSTRGTAESDRPATYPTRAVLDMEASSAPEDQSALAAVGAPCPEWSPPESPKTLELRSTPSVRRRKAEPVDRVASSGRAPTTARMKRAIRLVDFLALEFVDILARRGAQPSDLSVLTIEAVLRDGLGARLRIDTLVEPALTELLRGTAEKLHDLPSHGIAS